MIKLFKRKLIIILIATVATITIVSISTKTIFELHNAQNKKVQALNVKEKIQQKYQMINKIFKKTIPKS